MILSILSLITVYVFLSPGFLPQRYVRNVSYRNVRSRISGVEIRLKLRNTMLLSEMKFLT